MRDKNSAQPPQLLPLMVEDEATEKLKKRLSNAGLIVNARVSESQKQPDKKKGTKKRV